VLPVPATLTPEAWRITGLFLATIAGLMLQPLPGGALVVICATLLVLVGGVPITRALSGFATPTVWLVVAAMLISRVLSDTGLSRRIALLFVRSFGSTSLGVSYSLTLTDVLLAGGIPSITARSGGIVLPIARSLATLYGSTPGDSAKLLGAFLMATLYQTSAVACAMFFTGQASNVLAAGLASQMVGVSVTWSSWFLAGLVPGVASCIAVTYLVYRMFPPTIKRTPAATAFAKSELAAMGPLSRRERIALSVFVVVCALWITSGLHGLDVTVVALGGVGVLLLTDVLDWNTAAGERSAWDMFVWYGGLIMLGEVLNETGSTRVFAGWVGGWFGDLPWFVVMLPTLLIYFYAHYAFASITTHVIAMFPAFVTLLVGAGAPPALAVYSLACLANLTAGLTHYGTTTAPMVFAENYVSMTDWWRIGLAASAVNLAIWLTLGIAWWKVLGLW
jgi:DASS family divalent anion:Na+ symporter